MNLLVADRICLIGDEKRFISVIMPDVSLMDDACEIVQVVARIIAREALVVAGNQGDLCITPLGSRVLQIVDYDFEGILDALQGARIHPYIRIFKVVVDSSVSDEAHESRALGGKIGYLRFLEKAVLDGIEEKYGIPELKKASRCLERGARKNLSSVSKYLDDMFWKYSGICSVAVELRYIYSRWGDRQDLPSADVVRKDLDGFLRLVEEECPAGLRGYIWRVEFGLSDRFYARAIFFVDEGCVREFCECVERKGRQKLSVPNGKLPCTVEVYDFCSGSSEVEEFLEVDDLGLGIIREKLAVLFSADTLLKADVPGRGRCFGKAGPFVH